MADKVIVVLYNIIALVPLKWSARAKKKSASHHVVYMERTPGKTNKYFDGC